MIQKGKRAADPMSDASVADTPSAEPSLDRAVQSRIGDHLRQMYDELVQQPVPDRFVELLSRLAQRDEERAP